jgi:glycosyltransferase involved in cell wall biosynthesis
MISVLVLTKNEEHDLPGCLASVRWTDDVHVFDSHSTDRTVEIARAAGAHVTQRVFDGYASQRNAALQELPFRHPWVLILDADERVPVPLAQELQTFVREAAPEVAAGRMRRRDYLGDTWLRHSQISPYYIRLVRPTRVQYVREINERLLVDGPVHDLECHFDHFPFSKGIRHWIDKHNTYSTMEAKCLLEARRGRGGASLTRALFHPDFNERRFHQKELFYRLPARPLIKFCYVYFARAGFLDGRAGFNYALLQSIYEYMISLKARESAKATGA